MDTSGFCQVGRHGTLSLLKRQSVPIGSADDSLLTSFGIDDDELTFGSSTTCDVRLYYSDVDSLHCKIVFDQLKAFLAILGTSGVFVDGCQVFPHTSGELSEQTIVPLNNNSIFEIHGKRFKFNYPPKEIRKALYSTPARPPQRALRLSMIHSAQVFSPRPSNDPRENLRILQSPVKKPSSPIKHSSPLKSAILPQIEEEEIVLVQTNHPRVVEEDKDLVILESVPIQLLSPAKTTLQQTNQFPVVRAQPQPPCTPRRRSLGGTALHRAVLIRSAQRAVMKAEKEKEEEEEELEVLGTVVGDDDKDDEMATRTTGPREIEEVEMSDVDEDEDEETDSEDEDGKQEEQTQKSLWRKSLERIIPWSLGGSIVETEDEDRQEEEEDQSSTANVADNQKADPVELFPPIKPSSKVLGSFMTPQPRHQARNIDSKGDVRDVTHAGRFSLGGQARRIIVEQPWKVRDLVLPPTKPSTHPLMPTDPHEPSTIDIGGVSVATHLRSASSRTGTPITGTSITEEERRAIQDRRRSAVKELTSTPFWAGGAPGMSPAKGASDPSNRLSPNKSNGTVSPSKKFISPTKIRHAEHSVIEASDNHPNDDEDLDTGGLLNKIKETVNDMKRRRSVIFGGVGTPQSLTSVPEDSARHAANPTVSNAIPEEPSMRRVDFTKIGAPAKAASKHPPKSPQKNFADNDKGTEPLHQEEPFSLLRPGVLDGRRQSILSTPPRKEQVVTVVVPVPLVTVDHTSMDESGVSKETVPVPHSTRALRSGSNTTDRNKGCLDFGTENHDDDGKLKATKTNASGARRQRSKTPQPATLTDAATDVPSVDASQRASRSAASGKVTTADTIPEETDNVEKPAARRVRKTLTVANAEDEAKPTQVAPKRGRPRKNAAPTEASREVVTRSAGKPTSKVRSSARKKPPASNRETDSEDDPLDSYDIEEPPPSTSIEADNDMALESPPSSDVQSTTKTQAVVTKGKVATRIKQENTPDDCTPPATTIRVSRRAKASSVSQTPDVTPAVKAPSGKTRGRPKTPATAPANTGASIVEEKENTIGSRSSKLKSAEKEAEELPVKLRISRSRAASRKVAEEDEEQAPATRQRATRAMRTRTKTG